MTARYVTAATVQALEARLSGRDKAVLKSLSDLRFMSGSQLTRMHFDGTDQRTARRALLRLVRLDVLARLPRVVGGVRAGSGGFVYHLGLAGYRLAMERGWQPLRRRRRSLAPGTLFLAHSLQVAELHTVLTEAERSGRLELLELAAEPACWQGYTGNRGQAATLKPDSFGRFGIGDFEDSYWLEVDMGTEGSGAIDRQLRRYLDFQASGRIQAERGVFPRTLWLVPGAARAWVIEGCIERLPRPSRELFAAAAFPELLHVIGDPGNV
ncbi:MAG TPA: replication-relaxation family protein [Solirubrobacterales bacterium]